MTRLASLLLLAATLAACSPDFGGFETLDDDLCSELNASFFDDLDGEPALADDGDAAMAGPFLAPAPRLFAAGAREVLLVELPWTDPHPLAVASGAIALDAQALRCAGQGGTFQELQVNAVAPGAGTITIAGSRFPVEVRPASRVTVAASAEPRVATGARASLTADVLDAGGTQLYAYQSIAWSSSDPEVVDFEGAPRAGRVTSVVGKQPGTAKVTAHFGDLAASIVVTVE